MAFGKKKKDKKNAATSDKTSDANALVKEAPAILANIEQDEEPPPPPEQPAAEGEGEQMFGLSLAATAGEESQISSQESQSVIPKYSDSTSFGMKHEFVLRRVLIAIVENKWLDRLILLVIIGNCVLLSIADPLTQLSDWEVKANYWFLVIFTVEMVLKMLAMGIFRGKHAYFRNLWNCLDFIVVCCGWLPYVFPSLKNISALRSIRLLRPLQYLHRIPSMKFLVVSLGNSLPGILDGFVLCIFCFVIFAIMCMSVFQGKLHQRCTMVDEHGQTTVDANGAPVPSDLLCGPSTAPDICGAHAECRMFDSVENPHHGVTSFDTFGESLVNIMIIGSKEGYVPVMDEVSTATSQISRYWFVFMTLFGGFFITNLFLATIVSTFQAFKNPDAEEATPAYGDVYTEPHLQKFLSEDMERSDEFTEATAGLGAPPSKKKKYNIRWMGELADNDYFNWLSGAVIIANMAVMCMRYHGMSERDEQWVETTNDGFTCFFVAEMIFKLLGLGLKGYVADNFNCFDGTVVILCSVDLAYKYYPTYLVDLPVNVNFLRAVRLLRVFRLARNWVELRILLLTIEKSLMEFANLFFVIIIILYIFSILGMQMFGHVVMDETETGKMSFNTIGSSWLTSFIMMTGDGWTALYYYIRSSNGAAATVYFFTLRFLSAFMLLNLFIAIVLTNYDGTDAAFKADRKEEAPTRKHNSRRIIERTCGCLGPKSALRRMCWNTVTDYNFERFIWVCIFGSTFELAIDVPSVEPDSNLDHTLRQCNFFFATVFAAEMLMKWCAFGFYWTSTGYFKDGWNCLDAFIVGTSWACIIFEGSALGGLRVFRICRALRPLRMISKNPGLKIVAELVLVSIPGIVSSFLSGFLFVLIFALLGVELFSGRMSFCSEEGAAHLSSSARDDSHGIDKLECLSKEHHWHAGPFDNALVACLNLFVAATGSWTNLLYASMDSVDEVDQGPSRDHSPSNAIFFVSWQVLGGFFLINLFLAVIVDKFNNVKAEEGGCLAMTSAQKKWIMLMKFSLSAYPKARLDPPGSRFRVPFFNLVTHRLFDNTILAVIILNVAFMMQPNYGQSEAVMIILDLADLVFTSIYLVECFCKLMGLGWTIYWSNPWNKFDFTIVIASIVAVIQKYGASTIKLNLDPMLLRSLRMLRVLRLFRAMAELQGIRLLFRCLVGALPALSNVGGLCLMLVYIYTIIGMNLFFNVTPGEHLNQISNFDSFSAAFSLMLVTTTGEGWDTVMHDLSVTEDSGRCETGVSCGSPTAASIFFLTYVVLQTFMLLNMLVAIILDNFGDSQAMLDAEDSLEDFDNSWTHVDRYADGVMKVTTVPVLLRHMKAPFGMNKIHLGDDRVPNTADVSFFMKECPLIKARGGLVEYQEVLQGMLTKKQGLNKVAEGALLARHPTVTQIDVFRAGLTKNALARNAVGQSVLKQWDQHDTLVQVYVSHMLGREMLKRLKTMARENVANKLPPPDPNSPRSARLNL